ncbi:DNA-binding protein [Mycobacterium sp. MS1601]|uniref:YlxR family protein n=1 Tax=Mycobacterium sp. MS1601 TaxID=1936029 RepID=UPI0009794AF5|nr:YlxR family protein [Mycobacterium sp. MS1601]AQA05904.1 DNA-binding protein [Mycobacterium sp. MS1601]
MVQRETSAADTRKAPESRLTGKHSPVRTCVGCRKRELAVELLRVVAGFSKNDAGTDVTAVIVDTTGNLPGRGAWLHPRPDCVDAAIRRRAFARALRITGPQDTSAVTEHLSARHTAE